MTPDERHPHLGAVWALMLVACLFVEAVTAWAALYAWGRWG